MQTQNSQQQEESFKNFFKQNILVYFVYNHKIPKSVNYSRLYNIYCCIFELLLILILNVLMAKTNQSNVIISYTVLNVFHILTNFIPRIGVKHSYFKYMIILNTLIGLIYIAPMVFLVEAFELVWTICQMIVNYKESDAESDSACSYQYMLYFIWFGLTFLNTLVISIGLYFAWLAYKNLVRKHELEETKKRRKQRYEEISRKKDQKIGDMEKYGDRKL